MSIVNTPADAHSKPPPTDMYTNINPYLRVIAFGIALGISLFVLLLFFHLIAVIGISRSITSSLDGMMQLNFQNSIFLFIGGFLSGMVIALIYNGLLFFRYRKY